MKPFFTVLSLLVLLLAGPAADPARAADETVRAGRVLVVANGYSPASVELARYYMLRRGLPPMNLLLVFPAGKLSVTPENFTEKIMKPISRRCALLGGRNIDYVVLCRDVPYRTGDFSAATAVMFGGVNRIQAGQGYHGQTRAFESCIPSHFINLLPTTILSAYTMDEAIALIDASQTVYNNPKTAGRWYFCDGAGPRGMRNPQIPTAMELLDRNGIRISHETTPNVESRSDILGQFTGDVWLKLAGNRYMPGSILDNLTSYGGCLLDNRGQADLLSFVQHGVCGAYGAVLQTIDEKKLTVEELKHRVIKPFRIC